MKVRERVPHWPLQNVGRHTLPLTSFPGFTSRKIRAPNFGPLLIPDTKFKTITQLRLGHAVWEHSSYAVILIGCPYAMRSAYTIGITHVIANSMHGSGAGKVK